MPNDGFSDYAGDDGGKLSDARAEENNFDNGGESSDDLAKVNQPPADGR